MSDPDKEAFDAKVQEMKAGIARLIEPHQLPGAGGVITLALLELGIERHVTLCPDEKSTTDLVLGAVRKVLRRRDGTTQ